MDDDGASAYILYNSYDAGGQNTIDKLTPDFTASTITQNSGWLPMPGGDSGEAQAMVRRNGVYFAVFGHYCCFCAQGSGAVVHTATSPLGPYTLTGQWDRSMPAPPHCPAMPRHDNTIQHHRNRRWRVLGVPPFIAQSARLCILPDHGVTQ